MNKNVHRVLSTHAGRAVVEIENKSVTCFIKTKKRPLVTNDFVEIQKKTNAFIATSISPRGNVLCRQYKNKKKIIAANVDHLFIVVSAEPNFSAETLLKVLASALKENLRITILVNKIDLVLKTKKLKQILNLISPFDEEKIFTKRVSAENSTFFKILNIEIFECSCYSQERLKGLKKLILSISSGKTESSFAFTGQSGTGKSRLINFLSPDADTKISPISTALNTGKHTTSSSNCYRMSTGINEKIWVIDTPGIENYGIEHLSLVDLERIFPDWKLIQEHFGKCKFENCIHDLEPGCQVKKLLNNLSGNYVTKTKFLNLKTRLKIWLNMLREIKREG